MHAARLGLMQTEALHLGVPQRIPDQRVLHPGVQIY